MYGSNAANPWHASFNKCGPLLLLLLLLLAVKIRYVVLGAARRPPRLPGAAVSTFLAAPLACLPVVTRRLLHARHHARFLRAVLFLFLVRRGLQDLGVHVYSGNTEHPVAMGTPFGRVATAPAGPERSGFPSPPALAPASLAAQRFLGLHGNRCTCALGRTRAPGRLGRTS